MGSAVVWFEVAGTDLESLTPFYSELFDWKIDADESGYGMVETGAEGGIPGGVFAPGADAGTWTTFYVDVPDIEAALTAATQLGGAVLQPATPVPGGAVIGQISDPQGQRVGLYQQPPS